jgi:hypothetical protein
MDPLFRVGAKTITPARPLSHPQFTFQEHAMQIQVNSDKNIAVDGNLALFVRGQAGRALQQFKDKLTRVEFHLSDVNGPKFATHDKRCLVEARPARHRPLAVRATAPTVRSAICISLSRLRNALETFFGRLRTRRTIAKRTAKSALPRAARKGTQSKDLIEQPIEYAVRSRQKSAATRRLIPPAAKKAIVKKAASKQPASGGRGPKKKKIYQARRKAWPRR